MDISLPRQRGLKRKADPSCRTTINLLQHQPPCPQSRQFRRKGREAGGDQVGIDEGGDAQLQGPILVGKRGFPAPLGPAMMMIRFSATLSH